ncbi:MAG: phage shock protein PspA [Alphaproteobacteria bacterium]
MGIFSRLTDIINSNLNAMLDRAEEPEKMIRLIIQEMEDTLVEVRSTAAKSIAEKKEIQRRLSRLSEAEAEWERKAELALSRDREDLAKAALIEKAKVRDTVEALGRELEQLDHALMANDADVASLERKLVEAKAKQKAIQTRHETAGARLKVRRRLYENRVSDAFERFEKVQKRLDALEADAEAYDLGQRRTLADEIDELAAASKIEDEFEALKDRVTKRKPKDQE